MQQVTIQNGSTIPFILKAGEYIKITTSSLGAGTVAVPGESIADTLVASTEYAYGKFSAQREVIVLLTAGSADRVLALHRMPQPGQGQHGHHCRARLPARDRAD